MSGRPPSSAAVGHGDDRLCRGALKAIEAERSLRARRRRDTSPSQAGYLVGQLIDAKRGAVNLSGTIGELVELGPPGLEELVARFPGPLWRDPRVERSELPRAAEMGPLPMALSCFGPRVYPVVVALLASTDPEDRLLGAAVAPSFPDDRVLEAIVQLCLHGDPDARRMALRALRRMDSVPGYPQALTELRALWSDTGQRTLARLRALHVLAQLGDATLVPQLVELLGSAPSNELHDAAHEALCVLTAHDFGPHPLLWRVWLGKRGHLPRHLWLLSGLRARRERLRRHALSALSRLLDRPLDAGPDCDRRACVALAQTLERELAVR